MTESISSSNSSMSSSSSSNVEDSSKAEATPREQEHQEPAKEEKVENEQEHQEPAKEEKVENEQGHQEPAKEEKVEPVKEEKVEPVKEEKVEPVKEEKVEPVKEEKVEPAKEEKVENEKPSTGDEIDESDHSQVSHLNRSGINHGSTHNQQINSDDRQKTPTLKATSVKPPAKLSWKSDPLGSFSDWRVEIICLKTSETAVFHLHRNILGFGPRRSDYFLRQFTERLNEFDTDGEGNFSVLELEKGRADVFPMVLDFMYYTKEVKQTLTAERSCAVYSLAEFLEVPALQRAVTEFYRKNLSLNNMTEFLGCAAQYKAEELLMVAKAKIGSLITERPELAGLVPPHFLADILHISKNHMDALHAKEPTKYTKEWQQAQSRYWSRAASICAIHNEADMNKELFEKLTDEKALPAVDPSVALKLLAMDAKLNIGTTDFNSLQRRCVDSITDHWEAFQRGFSSGDAVSKALKVLPSHVLADILIKSMTRPQSNPDNGASESSPVLPKKEGGEDELEGLS
jgi:chemotaxis protein histidine kinase CheA